MATLAWSAFFPDVLVEVPGVSDPLAERHLREAAIAFCRRSRAYVYRMEEVAVDADTATYDWDIPSNTLVTEPIEVWLDGTKLTPKTPAELSALYEDWTTEAGTPLYYVSDITEQNARQVTLVPIPDAAGSLTARLALKPTRDAGLIDEIIYEEYGQVIAQGAVASLLLMVNKPWSNPQVGAAFKQRFEAACAQHGIRAEKGNTRAPLRTSVVHGVT